MIPPLHITSIDEVHIADNRLRYVPRCDCGWSASPKREWREAVESVHRHRIHCMRIAERCGGASSARGRIT